jgi:hypothetical protein
MVDEDSNIKDYIQLKNRIIKSIIKELFKNKITCNRKGEILNEQELLSILINTSNKVEKCLGVIISNNFPSQCTKNALFNGYCKQHLKKYETKKYEIENQHIIDYEMENDNFIDYEIEDKKNSYKNKIKKFINDSFYYVDNNFIYSLENMNTKVGYIKNGEYIISDDPFILKMENI